MIFQHKIKFHPWAVSPKQAAQIQRNLAGHVRIHSLPPSARLIAGVDSAFGKDVCLAGVVVWDAKKQAVVEQQTAVRKLNFPYIPGFLSFREAPSILAALRKLKSKPDVLMADGHGLAHPRRFGIACHLGVLTGLPAIGCAKTRLIGEEGPLKGNRGDRASLTHKGELVGLLVRTQTGTNPVYVSVGHKSDLPSAAKLTLRCATRHRLPEPTRLADRLVAAKKKTLKR